MRRKISPREAKRMMQRMGLSMDTIPDVEEVIVKTSTKEIIIERPEVAVLKLRGQQIFQITGENIVERQTEKKIEIPEEDIRLVADQTGKSMEEAKKALEESGGDLAKAILLLQTR